MSATILASWFISGATLLAAAVATRGVALACWSLVLHGDPQRASAPARQGALAALDVELVATVLKLIVVSSLTQFEMIAAIFLIRTAIRRGFR